jgi:UDP-N-acetylglucosamine acyltransferase
LEIHPTAIIHPRAMIAPGVKIGAYSVVGENVQIRKDTVLESHVVVEGWTQIGERCHLFPFASVGAEPQAVRYRGEPTRLTIGQENIIREFVTINRGTVEGGGETILGNGNLIMAYSHVAHDCMIGNRVILANASTLGGHIQVEDFALVGGLVAIHQFVRVGCYSIIGGASAAPQDVPPYMVASGNRARLYGLNNVGLKRHNFPEATLAALKQAYRIIFRSHLPLHKALDKAEKEAPRLAEVEHLIDFIRKSKRGVCR